jgi:hypothetical protein
VKRDIKPYVYNRGISIYLAAIIYLQLHLFFIQRAIYVSMQISISNNGSLLCSFSASSVCSFSCALTLSLWAGRPFLCHSEPGGRGRPRGGCVFGGEERGKGRPRTVPSPSGMTGSRQEHHNSLLALLPSVVPSSREASGGSPLSLSLSVRAKEDVSHLTFLWTSHNFFSAYILWNCSCLFPLSKYNSLISEKVTPPYFRGGFSL